MAFNTEELDEKLKEYFNVSDASFKFASFEFMNSLKAQYSQSKTLSLKQLSAFEKIIVKHELEELLVSNQKHHDFSTNDLKCYDFMVINFGKDYRDAFKSIRCTITKKLVEAETDYYGNCGNVATITASVNRPLNLTTYFIEFKSNAESFINDVEEKDTIEISGTFKSVNGTGIILNRVKLIN